MMWLFAWWRWFFRPKPIALPGKFPWGKPPPLAFGTLLVKGRDFDIVADGKGGVTVAARARKAKAR